MISNQYPHPSSGFKAVVLMDEHAEVGWSRAEILPESVNVTVTFYSVENLCEACLSGWLIPINFGF